MNPAHTHILEELVESRELGTSRCLTVRQIEERVSTARGSRLNLGKMLVTLKQMGYIRTCGPDTYAITRDGMDAIGLRLS